MTANTPAGNGFLPKIVRSLLHVLLVHQAVAREWPMTIEQANAEVTIAHNDLEEITARTFDILSSDALESVKTWTAAVFTLKSTLGIQATAVPEDPLPEETKTLIQGMYQSGLDVLAALDLDLLGILSDAGTTP